MTLREDAIARFGAEWVDALEATAGCHSDQPVPAVTSEERLVFALLEAIDWECAEQDWTCPERKGFKNALCGVSSSSDMEALLLAHLDAVRLMRIPIPSLLGVVSGNYDFLLEKL